MAYEDYPMYGLFEATVIATDDPEQQGRVRLVIPSVLGSDESGWAPILVSDLSGDIPFPIEVGTSVVVGFLDGRMSSPFVLGMLSSDRDV